MKVGNPLALAAAIVVCELAGAIGSVFTIASIPTWYALLNKPSFSPPNWVFAPVWITLYALMGIAAYLVWKQGGGFGNKKVKEALAVFAVQLVLNALWSFLFFGLKNPLYALAGIIALWIAILASIAKFREISKTAAYLLIPYLLWVSFATILNYSIWALNP